MTWGTELWDQHSALVTHTSRGIDFIDRYCRFVKDRCDLENRYAADIRCLVKKYQFRKKNDEQKFTSQAAFQQTLCEFNDMAGQHEVIAEQLNTSLDAGLLNNIKELKEERKRLLGEAVRLQTQMQNQRVLLEKSKRNYERSHREAEKSAEVFRKADADLNLSRAEVAKHKMALSVKNQHCEDCKNEYANQLEKTNDLQLRHYTSLLPAVYDELEAVDMERCRHLQQHLRQMVAIQRSVIPIIDSCLGAIVGATELINPEEDAETVVECYKSGFSPPSDIPFEQLHSCSPNSVCDSASDCSVSVNSSPATSCAESPRLGTASSLFRSTLSSSKFRKRSGILSLFSAGKEDLKNLPPVQQKKRIQAKIDDLTAKLGQETSTREGLMKMKNVYEGNPALGDPLTIEAQLRDNTCRLEKLRTELAKYNGLLDSCDSLRHQSQFTGVATDATNIYAMDGENGSDCLARNKLRTPFSGHASSNSPESGLGTSHTSLHEQDSIVSPSSDACRINSDHASGIEESSHRHVGVVEGRLDRHDHVDSALSANCDELDRYLDDDEVSTINDETVDVLPVISTATALYRFDDTFLSDDFDNDEIQSVPLPAISTCAAIYDFTATSDGSMSMCEGETLLVIEADQGDGWTRVRRSDSSYDEGFVPSSYLRFCETSSKAA